MRTHFIDSLFTGTRVSILAAISIVIAASYARAEVSCESKLSYSWETSAGTEKDVEPQKLEVVLEVVRAGGTTENEARSALEQKLSRRKVDAFEECRKRHENLAGCISKKYSSMADTVRAATFTARRAIEEAISADCQRAQGRCLGTAGTEAQCVSPPETDKAVDGEVEDEATAKKKKERKQR